MPSSWERSCLDGKTDSPHHTDPPEPTAPEGFLLSEAWLIEICRRRPERETRIPGLARKRACPSARGLLEGTRRKPDTDGRAGSRARNMRRAVDSAATLQFRFAALFSRLKPTLVVKMSDTSHPPGKRVRIPPLTHALWRYPCKGCHAPQRRFSAGRSCVAVTESRYRLFPSVPFKCRSPTGMAVVKMSVTSVRVPARLLRSGGRVVQIPPAEMP
jgi:hypothetical protein